MVSPASPEDSDQLDVSAEVLWAVADEWARRALRTLHEAERDLISLDELADQVAREYSDSRPDGTHKAKLRLHHSSLPRLDELGLVEYDRESNIVRNNPEKRLPEDLKDQLHALEND